MLTDPRNGADYQDCGAIQLTTGCAHIDLNLAIIMVVNVDLHVLVNLWALRSKSIVSPAIRFADDVNRRL